MTMNFFVSQSIPIWVLWVAILVLVIVASPFLLVWTRSLLTNRQLAKSEADQALNNFLRLQGEFEQLRVRYELLQKQKNSVDILLAQGEARWQERDRAYVEKMSLLQTSQEKLTQEFQNIANRLFDEKQEQFSRLSVTQIENAISPFHLQLRDFYQRVDEFHRQDIAQRNQLLGQISELQKQSQQIGLDAVNLASALKGNNKTQGMWGELVLDRVLEQAGLQLGREFETQVAYTDEHGKRFQPDAIVHLPGKKQIIVDAKVSLVAYERYANSEEKEQRNSALKEHVESVRAHIKSLSSKNYDRLAGVNTLDFVCLFIPIEAAFIALAQYSPAVLQEAYEHKIILVSPSSLLLVLKTVDSLWQRDRQDRNVELIVETAGKLHDQFVRFIESMMEVGASLNKAQSAHNKAYSRLTEGRGNLIKRAEDLKRLGAKTSSKLPTDLVRDSLVQSSFSEEISIGEGVNDENPIVSGSDA